MELVDGVVLSSEQDGCDVLDLAHDIFGKDESNGLRCLDLALSRHEKLFVFEPGLRFDWSR